MKKEGVIIHRGISALDNKTEIIVIAKRDKGEIKTWILVENRYPTEVEERENKKEVEEVYREYKRGEYEEYEEGKHKEEWGKGIEYKV